MLEYTANHTITFDKMIPVSEVIVGKNIRPINSKHLENLINSYDPAEPWDAIIVERTSDGYLLVDGHHRVEAAKRLELSQILAKEQVFSGETDRQVSQYDYNIKNGLPLTMKEKTTFVKLLHTLHPEYSNRQLGKRAGLHHSTVRTILEQAMLESSNDSGGDPGKTMGPQKFKSVGYFAGICKEMANYEEPEDFINDFAMHYQDHPFFKEDANSIEIIRLVLELFESKFSEDVEAMQQ